MRFDARDRARKLLDKLAPEPTREWRDDLIPGSLRARTVEVLRSYDGDDRKERAARLDLASQVQWWDRGDIRRWWRAQGREHARTAPEAHQYRAMRGTFKGVMPRQTARSIIGSA